jgi:hypothetical protein
VFTSAIAFRRRIAFTVGHMRIDEEKFVHSLIFTVKEMHHSEGDAPSKGNGPSK